MHLRRGTFHYLGIPDSRSVSVSSLYGLETSMPAFFCSSDQLVLPPVIPRPLPEFDSALASESCLSVMIRSSSYFSILPNPLHSGHAQRGWLKEKRIGDGSGTEIPHSSHTFFEENWSVSNSLLRLYRCGRGHRHKFSALTPAFSIESASLGSSCMTSRSRTTT